MKIHYLTHLINKNDFNKLNKLSSIKFLPNDSVDFFNIQNGIVYYNPIYFTSTCIFLNKLYIFDDLFDILNDIFELLNIEDKKNNLDILDNQQMLSYILNDKQFTLPNNNDDLKLLQKTIISYVQNNLPLPFRPMELILKFLSTSYPDYLCVNIIKSMLQCPTTCENLMDNGYWNFILKKIKPLTF